MVMWRWKNTVLKKSCIFCHFILFLSATRCVPTLMSRTASTFCFSVSDLSIKLSKQGRVHPWICAV